MATTAAQMKKYTEEIRGCLDKLMAPSSSMEQKSAATSTLSGYLRMRMREDAFVDKFLTFEKIGADKIDVQLNNELPIKIEYKEPNSPPAMAIGFGSFPDQYFIEHDRYFVQFQRLVSTRFTKDVIYLDTVNYDIRQVVSDIAVNEIAKYRDRRYITACDTMIGAEGTAIAALGGKVLNQNMASELTRSSLSQACSIMGRTTSRLQPVKALMPASLKWKIQSFYREQTGGDFSEEMFLNGWTRFEFYGMPFYTTIKEDITGDSAIRFFAEEDKHGKAYELEELTMYSDPKGPIIDFFFYLCQGFSVANQASYARASFFDS